MKKKIAIIGAGFSGLTLARALEKLDFEAEVFEKSAQIGGLIQTTTEPLMVEHAAHALLSSAEVEDLFKELNVKMVKAGFKSKARWIFKDRPRKWPLNFRESFSLLPLLFKRNIKSGESVKDWVGSKAVNDHLVAPGLQGVYAAQTDQLSAKLVIGSLFDKSLKSKKGTVSGSVAPLKGMHTLLKKLAEKLTVHLNWSGDLQSLENFDAVVVATSLKGACDFFPELKKLPLVSLSCATLGFKEKQTGRPEGFGCLFPVDQNFSSIGVLFNTDIFEGRGNADSETWIFPYTFEKMSDEEVLEKIEQDRARFGMKSQSIPFLKLICHHQMLPLYGTQLENFLQSDFFVQDENDVFSVFRNGARVRNSKKPLYMSGNYLGGLGLSKILSYNSRLAQRLARELK